MATICPLGRPLGWKKKYFEILWGGHHGENQNKHWKKNATNRYLKSLWGGPHGEKKTWKNTKNV